MTATPIPRSLCLTQFGDLDLSVHHRIAPWSAADRDQPRVRRRGTTKAWDFIRQKLREGRQVYLVCPRIDIDEDRGRKNRPPAPKPSFAELHHQALQELPRRPGARPAGLARQRTDVMAAFRDGELHALVTTTVIEVGVDVPNATLMVIFEAERFGLSQLHQLRGRISRGKFQGYCFLFSEGDSTRSG